MFVLVPGHEMCCLTFWPGERGGFFIDNWHTVCVRYWECGAGKGSHFHPFNNWRALFLTYSWHTVCVRYWECGNVVQGKGLIFTHSIIEGPFFQLTPCHFFMQFVTKLLKMLSLPEHFWSQVNLYMGIHFGYNLINGWVIFIFSAAHPYTNSVFDHKLD